MRFLLFLSGALNIFLCLDCYVLAKELNKLEKQIKEKEVNNHEDSES